jgi:hypothetical protein
MNSFENEFKRFEPVCKYCNEPIFFDMLEKQWVHVSNESPRCFYCPVCGYRGARGCSAHFVTNDVRFATPDK